MKKRVTRPGRTIVGSRPSVVKLCDGSTTPARVTPTNRSTPELRSIRAPRHHPRSWRKRGVQEARAVATILEILEALAPRVGSKRGSTTVLSRPPQFGYTA